MRSGTKHQEAARRMRKRKGAAGLNPLPRRFKRRRSKQRHLLMPATISGGKGREEDEMAEEAGGSADGGGGGRERRALPTSRPLWASGDEKESEREDFFFGMDGSGRPEKFLGKGREGKLSIYLVFTYSNEKREQVDSGRREQVEAKQ